MKFFVLLSILLFLGCSNNLQPNSIYLYPGHVAKSQGKIIWFPIEPTFDEKSDSWKGDGGVEITSCIADPWPEGPGGRYAYRRILTCP